MYAEQDMLSLYDFLRHTPEGHLKKMMVSGKMTEVHFRVFLKIVRGCSNQEFIQYATQKTFPKIKLGSAEIPVKETLWDIALATCVSLGLLSAGNQKAAA